MQRKMYTDFQGAVAGGGVASVICMCGICWCRFCSLALASFGSSRVGKGLLAGYRHEEGFTVVTYLNPSF